ncbi:MAG: transcription termination/antitermination protein NusG [Candidatus Omnitrophica bacterium]|jgi:transcriptional antiterminator NusG|nr:transcription termination/antitermination protein NusG [Candidatus Omnitrophota bacterium]MDD4013138.1 transcription termination/antitermination protein NusG [Candidatus Omnitrophota bacterium]
MTRKWYVVHTMTGKENAVKKALENQLENNPGMKKFVTGVMIPTEKVSEVKEGEKRISERKFFPGYILLEMELNDESWYFIKNTPGITGFVGSKTKPVPLEEHEVGEILKQAEEAKEKPVPKVLFKAGESVRVKEGPFKNFSGTIEDTNMEKGKIRVMISIFGRTTPVELEAWQVEKM